MSTNNRWSRAALDALLDEIDNNYVPVQVSLRAGNVPLPDTVDPDHSEWEYEAFTWSADEYDDDREPKEYPHAPWMLRDADVPSSWLYSAWEQVPGWRGLEITGTWRPPLRFDNVTVEATLWRGGMWSGPWSPTPEPAPAEPSPALGDFGWENAGLRQAHADMCPAFTAARAPSIRHTWPGAGRPRREPPRTADPIGRVRRDRIRRR